MENLTPFQRHLSFFALPGTSKITILSALRSSLSLGLDAPFAIAGAIGLRLLYGSPFSLYLRPVDAAATRLRLTQLEGAPLAQAHYSRGELLDVAERHGVGLLESAHVVGMWALAADVRTGLVSRADVEAFQEGRLLERIRERRRETSDDVLPLWRGGPISVRGHAWFVDKMFGIKVYRGTLGERKGE